MMNMNIEAIARNLNLSDEKMSELLSKCGIVPRNGMVSMGETNRLQTYARENKFNYEQNAQAYLERSVKDCTIFIDTCELLNKNFSLLLERLAPLLKENGKKLYVPSGVEAELKNLYFTHKGLQERICAVAELLEEKEAEGIVEICGKHGETFADQQMLSIATCALLSENLLFITRDGYLGEDILHLNELGSVRGGRVLVHRITQYGYLGRFIPPAEREASRDNDSAA